MLVRSCRSRSGCDARLHTSALIAAIVLHLVSTSALAQDTTGVGAIKGVVFNAAGEAVPGVRVCALNTTFCATSDAQGAFRIGELRAGSYRMEVIPPEGLPITSPLVGVRAGLDSTVEISLPRVEGLVEDSLKASKSGYRAYIARTPASIPWFPRVPR